MSEKKIERNAENEKLIRNCATLPHEMAEKALDGWMAKGEPLVKVVTTSVDTGYDYRGIQRWVRMTLTQYYYSEEDQKAGKPPIYQGCAIKQFVPVEGDAPEWCDPAKNEEGAKL